ncbi:RagB/SusD family nutrient uptake outer membrane protein [Marinilabilia rubra]|uniref:RagB/SusD family nutrient uptake outer membrane protein n=2 Tax=Marinilabilia rubra TaxID=2162893 RepID=A0A2U2BBV0_9BACT|nr:RagB/SusD family nutrient uptake outer membrane protein [Marinilabilia rubra]
MLAITWAFMLGGCDYLDYDESSYLLKEDVFNEYSRTKKFLAGIYSQLPDDFSTIDGAMRSSGTDEAIHVNNLSNVRLFTDGNWSASQTLDTKWESMYSAIRDVNTFLKEIKGKTWDEIKWNEDYDEIMEQFNLYPYEARFLRAYFYFELLKRYGGVPIVETELTEKEANTVSRASFQEVVDYIVKECDEVSKVLPASFYDVTAEETGRATKGAAMALKARTLLYAASPLNNSANAIDKWESAALASKAIIDSAWYTLEGNYKDVVNNALSPELIFGIRQAESASFEKANFPIGYEGGNTGTCPTQNLVNAYEMVATGLPIDDPSSGYNPVFPYSGRDPRLNETVIVNGSSWKGKTVEVWYGGANAEPKPNATLTGYYLKKYVIESVNLEQGNVITKRHNWVLFRFAEVLLNYAEAMNEAYGPENAATLGKTALESINEVRLRAGMPEFPAGLTQSEFRTKLRNERRVELAFEDHRFWDVRRWMIGSETTEIKGVTAALNPFGGYVYEEKHVESRIWDERMNMYPIPQSELYKNPNLTQNSGW